MKKSELQEEIYKKQLIKKAPWLEEILNCEAYKDYHSNEKIDSDHEYLYWKVDWGCLPYKDIAKIKELYRQLGGERD